MTDLSCEVFHMYGSVLNENASSSKRGILSDFWESQTEVNWFSLSLTFPEKVCNFFSCGVL